MIKYFWHREGQMSLRVCIIVVFGVFFCVCSALFGAIAGDPNAVPDANGLNFQGWSPDVNVVLPARRLKTAPEEPTRPKEEGQMSSAVTAESFYRLGKQLYTGAGVGVQGERTALQFMNAAVALDSFAAYAIQDYVYLKTRLNEREDWQKMRRLLINYLDRQPETEVARGMVRYLLDDLNSREERERTLADLLTLVADKNKELGSDIAAEQGLLAAEKGDTVAATDRFLVAYRLNPYNELACTKLEESAQNLTPSFYGCKLKLAIAKNPLDMRTAFAFAAFMEGQGAYSIAAKAYEYAASLHKYLYPNQNLPREIYLPWTLCCYNVAGIGDKCIEIAKAVRGSGQFDAVAEGIALKAAEKEGMADKAKEIAAGVEAKLGEMTGGAGGSAPEVAETAAWYYAFAAKDGGKALSWANKAYAAEPNSATVKALLVYALVINGQADVASGMVNEATTSESGQPEDQITALALAVKLLGEQKKEAAVAMLKTAIAKRPDSIEASEARQLLAFSGETYSGVNDATLSELLTDIKATYGEDVVGKWSNPEKMISMKLLSRMEGAPSFDTELKIELSIMNTWSGPLMIGPGTMLGSSIRVDGELTGDVQKMMPALVLKSVGRGVALMPRQTMLVPLDMNLNGIYTALEAYPQANLNIVFTAYLDPVEEGGKVRNRIAGMVPGSVTIERKGVNASRELVANRLDVLGKGYQTQKVQAVKMFASLWRERIGIDKGLVKYKAAKLEPALLKSAIKRGLDDEDWTVKVQTMASIAGMELDFDLTNSVAADLQSKYWPVRMMGIYLLGSAQGGDFDKVLKWYFENDSNDNVRLMKEAPAVAEKKGP
jgi:tetratricopeptide (TPR) repeat protein